ncbi:DUF2971 domain-containing protein [uncultured Algoriphagus sp.]|uniref:DUF2971 domain-containing protein n=1 Tax=uncultured Algoriphagus sp. TaxID=417365 RepID=UPI0030ECD9D3|tara:strand:+ start:141 stop:944 length:804 start_codon:yes stop_codon:yes gene_type:complete
MKEPDIIYKYKDFTEEYSRMVFTKNELFLSSPESFNDPFDCRIPPCLKLLGTKERSFEYAARILNTQKSQITALGNEFDKVSDDYKNLMWNKPEVVQNVISQITFDVQNKILGVLSLTNKWNDILMWSHYGNNHKGICYGFDLKALQNSKEFTYGGFVHYSNDYPLIDPIKSIEIEAASKQTHHKASNWKYEEEYRLVKIYDNDIDQFSEKRKFTIPDSFFKEIIIGARFPESEFQNIISLAETKQVALYKAKKVDWKFELQRERIV